MLKHSAVSNQLKDKFQMAISNDTTHSIYRIVCFVTGKCYVGRTMDVEGRKVEHFRALRLKKHHSTKLQRAYNKYGLDKFYFEVIESGVSSEAIESTEIQWIEHFNSYHAGYNDTLGGDNPPPHRRICTWNGVEYPSVTAAARALRIPRIRLSARLRAGHTADSDLTGVSVPINYNGIQYKSITDAAQANNISISTMRGRIRRGYQSNSDMPGNVGAKIAKECEWNGVHYRSLKDASKALGITSTAMRKRLRRGWVCDSDMPFRRK